MSKNNECQSNPESNLPESNVVDLGAFRQKKAVSQELAPGRKPLYVSHLSGRISPSNSSKNPGADFGDRLQRIRTSLDKINNLMNELKKMSDAPLSPRDEDGATSNHLSDKR